MKTDGYRDLFPVIYLNFGAGADPPAPVGFAVGSKADEITVGAVIRRTSMFPKQTFDVDGQHPDAAGPAAAPLQNPKLTRAFSMVAAP